MRASNPQVVIRANAPEALVHICGISLLERLLRNLQRLGFREANILSGTTEKIVRALAQPSWARAEIQVEVVAAERIVPATRVLWISAAFYHDPRILEALCARHTSTLVVDSDSPATLRPLVAGASHCGAALLVEQDAASFAPETAADTGRFELLDVRELPTYVVSLRRDVRPLWFPAPAREQAALAEALVLAAAQNGTLDLPAIVHAPIETWIIHGLCKTRITPNQITLLTVIISAGVTILFATGRLTSGVILALVVGVLDGLDGKQARVKVETTALGKREHLADYVLELSWWTALGFRFDAPGALLLLVVSDAVDRLAKRAVKKTTGRNLDDVAPIDRFVRLIGGRRNIYVWVFAIGLAARISDKAFFALCLWGAMTAGIHVLRAFYVTRAERVPE